MAVFVYKALDNRSTAIQGTISADNLRTARDLLRGRGLMVESVTEQAESGGRSWWPFKRRARHMAKRVEMVAGLRYAKVC